MCKESSAAAYAARLRGPDRVPQPAEDLSKEQRDIDHMMRCTKVGCTRCA